MLRNLGIRARIAGGSLIIAILISVAAGIVFNSQISRIVREGTQSVLRSDSAPYVLALQTEPAEHLDPPGPSQLVAVVAPDGSTPVDTLPAPLGDLLHDIVGGRTTASVSAGGSDYVVRVTPVDVSGRNWTVVAARSAEEETTILTQMRLLLIIGLALISAGTAVAAWLLSSASLLPVRRLRASAERLSASTSTELLDGGDTRDEISDLARTLNDLIERLRASAQRERQLVSDASHELRTPLSILNAQLQVAIAEASSIEQLTADIRGAQGNVLRLSSLVTSLLELSAIEAVGAYGSSSARELEEEVSDAVTRLRAHSAPADVRVDYDSPTSVADGDTFAIRRDDLGRVVDNLMTNALRAMGDTGRLEVGLRCDGHDLVLSVADTGGGMEPDFLAAAFDRFSRSDESRAGGQGSGLGLAIVSAIVHNAEGSIRLDNRPGEGLTVTVSLPVEQTSVPGL